MKISQPQSIFLPLLLLALALPATAQTTTDPESVGLSESRLDRIADLVDRYIVDDQIAGAITVVARHGETAYFKTQGVMDIEAREAMRPDAIFRMASMSKPVTGVAIMMLLEEGRLRLEDPVSRFIPEFQNT